MVDSTYHGYAQLEPGVTGSFYSTYFFSQSASDTTTTQTSISGGGIWAQGQVYTKADTIPTASYIYSPCGANGILNINNRIALTSTNSSAMGELTDDDPMRDGKPHDTFTFDADRGHEVTVTMTAGDFDTYLVVESPDGQEWANDDFGSTRVSQVTFNAPEAGTYTIVATAWSDSGRGRYEVRATALRAEILSTVSGRLDYQDRQLVKGEYVDTFTVQGPRDGTFYITLTPLGFSGYLRVTSPTGTETRGQYNYSEQTIRLGPFQVERGDWTVDVTTLAADEVGAYDVRVVALKGE